MLQLHARTALHGVDMKAKNCDCFAFCHGAEGDTLDTNTTTVNQWYSASVHSIAGRFTKGRTKREGLLKLARITELLEC